MRLVDETDRELISVLRRDGRAPVSKIAEILDVSRATVQRRLDSLVEDGVVLGFTVRAREAVDAEGVSAMMALEVRDQNASAVIRRLRGIPELRTLYSTNGKWDLIAMIEAQDLSDFDRVLGEVREVTGIANSETNILLSAV
ncbi:MULTISPECIES: Lrp/AsnC family transcriptional regulator [unclassified Roseivivax]|uniref:Lrp/AsnC family transcriptional regulator n=1 Tax=Roseivivax sp. GX 12232 TaxID=2900547 RepID=UPI001E566A17|nr:Lrp/AsnC family transcriptional regulator [Roseivivax sp. GX 12232]MCE0505873.1 Lrp/AsnC family transcriptional regulator [Roseivivax sp. GX 12232]